MVRDTVDPELILGSKQEYTLDGTIIHTHNFIVALPLVKRFVDVILDIYFFSDTFDPLKNEHILLLGP